MSIYIRGDIHADAVSAFSYKRHPKFRNWTKDDIVVVLGDVGLPFGINAPYFNPKEDQYQINFIASKPPTFVFLCGNHDDRDAIGQMPIVEKFGGKVRQMMYNNTIYENMFYVDTPQILDLDGNKCLCLSGAQSHDIDDGILDPNDEDFHWKYPQWSKDPYKMFRVRGWSWWDDEDVDIDAARTLVENNADTYFDFILSHESPAIFNQRFGKPFRLKSTPAQEFLDNVRQTITHDIWMHGHQHMDTCYVDEGGKQVWCLYNFMYKEDSNGNSEWII